MCGAPVIRMHDALARRQSEVDLFARVLREVFGDAPWDEVEASARQAWRHVGQITGQPWMDVRESIRHAWIVRSLH